MSAGWRGVIEEYRDRLPVSGATPVVTLLEGGTPLLPAPELSRRTGCEVFLKVEGANPTGSFKDRGMTVAISKAVEEGAKAEGVQAEVPKAPIWFSKPHTALVGCGADVLCDESFTGELDYEGELAVVIGQGGRDIAPENALGHVFGYTILNDLTARDVQQSRNQWFKGKSADTYAPLGPVVVTADEIPDYRALRVRTIVDGEVRQEDSPENMIFAVPTLLADISRELTLEPGDIIGTGTPSGVAWVMDEPGYLEPGSVVSVEIEGIGMLWNRVVASP